jgi:hypothetical protein
VPGAARGTAPKPAEPGPSSLDGALGQLTGKPGEQPAGALGAAGAGARVPLDPAKVEQFKALARQTLVNFGVPPDQVEARVDAMVAAAQRPQPAYTPPKPDKMPPPGFGEGFGDRWFDTEQGIKNLIGQGGPGAPGVLESWRDLITSTNDQLANPVGTAIDEVKNAVNSPSAAYYLGGKAADGVMATPGLMFGGEGVLAARAGALDDIAASGAIPHSLIDNPTPTGAIEHSTAAPLGDIPSHHSTHAPLAGAPLPPESSLFDGYDPTPPGPAFTNPDGGLIYPDDSLPSKPYAVPGTVIDDAEIPQGTAIDRFGSPFGCPQTEPHAKHVRSLQIALSNLITSTWLTIPRDFRRDSELSNLRWHPGFNSRVEVFNTVSLGRMGTMRR